MTTTISIILASICFALTIFRVGRNFLKRVNTDKITFVRGDKKITVSQHPTPSDRKKLAHF
jgi:hypothetical protein